MEQNTERPAIAEDLVIGAPAISMFIYGNQDRIRDVYRNVLGLSFFKHGNSIAAFKSTIRDELIEREKAARAERQRSLNDDRLRPIRRKRSMERKRA
jgi:hypothetical protein